MTEPFKRAVLLGSGPDGDVWVEIRWQDRNGGMELSLSGVEGPMRSGNCKGSCGQIVDHLQIDRYASGWDRSTVTRLVEVWDRWHLNRMRAGTPAQQRFLEAHRDEYPGYPISHYDWAKAALTRAGLQPDDGYSYGSKWLSEEVPDDVVQWLHDLPEPTKTYPWSLM